MSKYKCCSACDSNPRVKGMPDGDLDWPEVMPHKKAGRKKGKGTKRGDHKHIYVWTAEEDPYVYTLWDGRKMVYDVYTCAEWTCQKVKRSRMRFI